MVAEEQFDLFSSLRYDPALLHCEANSQLYGLTFPNAFYMLPYHRDRMLSAATHFGWPQAIKTLDAEKGLTSLYEVLSAQVNEYYSGKSIHENERTPLKVRVLLAETGKLTVELSPTPAVTLQDLYPKDLKLHDTFVGSSKTGGALQVGSGTSAISGLQPWDIIIDSQRTDPTPFTSFKTTARAMYSGARERAGIKSFQDKAEVVLINPNGEAMEGSLTSVFFYRGGRWVTPPVESGGQVGTTRRWLLEQRQCEEEVVDIKSIKEGEECYISNGVRGLTWGRIKATAA
ncbi:D-aminoacid aminotransferase-like PLP-dependent enzyme [Xylona heveae TC161]|uniref:D-aminoacid aminotransferase-like PLP-dependent enzyme n=1 Tax=Xylona heveae (strain CBS 132557 / TC161) TaxID=1328760 RepID=A0A164ZVV1_XYLHT|nr:D-aminoacid aminotransferase-like PLP-dependent enzyme [Xylona heveae TC161]KZF19596.1 D-aminoacid aminotransferase-like PLP-dependent enzyme [Xylona heveae TC161]